MTGLQLIDERSHPSPAAKALGTSAMTEEQSVRTRGGPFYRLFQQITSSQSQNAARKACTKLMPKATEEAYNSMTCIPLHQAGNHWLAICPWRHMVHPASATSVERMHTYEFLVVLKLVRLRQLWRSLD